MAVFVYCARPSLGARELTDAIGAVRVRKFDGMDFWKRGKKIPLEPGDAVVCWGAQFPEVDEVRVLNPATREHTKALELQMLAAYGVDTIQTLDMNPAKYNQTYGQTYDVAVWVPRTQHHQGGEDLLHPPQTPDFWVRREEFVREFRLHHFNGRSIRAGEKVHRDGFENPHPWIRSFDAGWRVKYDDFATTKQLRLLAKKAVKAVGCMFGAVDIGERADGKLVVLEVNRAPGLEGNTITAYAKAIERWLNESGRTAGDVEADERA